MNFTKLPKAKSKLDSNFKSRFEVAFLIIWWNIYSQTQYGDPKDLIKGRKRNIFLRIGNIARKREKMGSLWGRGKSTPLSQRKEKLSWKMIDLYYSWTIFIIDRNQSLSPFLNKDCVCVNIYWKLNSSPSYIDFNLSLPNRFKDLSEFFGL